jgi:hypothetical protein
VHEQELRDDLLVCLKSILSKVDIIGFILNSDESISMQMQVAPINLIFKLLQLFDRDAEMQKKC